MRRLLAPAALVIACLAMAAVLTACGGSGGSGGAATATGPANAAAGAKVFASAGCGSCHTFKAAGSSGSVGPNLDDLHPSEQAVHDQVEHGGGSMPAFKGQLSGQEIADVAAYVADNAGK